MIKLSKIILTIQIYKFIIGFRKTRGDINILFKN